MMRYDHTHFYMHINPEHTGKKCRIPFTHIALIVKSLRYSSVYA